MHTSHSPQEANENLNHLTALLFQSLLVYIFFLVSALHTKVIAFMYVYSFTEFLGCFV